jgi:hypothetical protein
MLASIQYSNGKKYDLQPDLTAQAFNVQTSACVDGDLRVVIARVVKIVVSYPEPVVL